LGLGVAEPPYTDDESIGNACRLFRRVRSKPEISIVWDDNLGCWRPSSAAFRNDRDGQPMSIALECELDAHGLAPASVLAGHEGFSLAYITAALARRLAQIVVKDPLPLEPAHGLVVGDKPRKVQKEMAKVAIWEVAPRLPPPSAKPPSPPPSG
jgi:hypothetical protein